MEKEKLEELRDRVPCAAVLEQAGFAIDVKESTRKAVKYRRNAEIVIVIHGGRGWFDPLSDAKGDVFGLAEHLDGVTFVEALDRVAALVGIVARDPAWSRPAGKPAHSSSVFERWATRRRPWQGSMTWRYLRSERCLSATIIREAIQSDVLREGPYGSMWAAHVDDDGVVTGWEERGPDWRGFSTGGSKILFRLGSPDATRLCVGKGDGRRYETLLQQTGADYEIDLAITVTPLGAISRLEHALDRFGNEQRQYPGGWKTPSGNWFHTVPEKEALSRSQMSSRKSAANLPMSRRRLRIPR